MRSPYFLSLICAGSLGFSTAGSALAGPHGNKVATLNISQGGAVNTSNSLAGSLVISGGGGASLQLESFVSSNASSRTVTFNTSTTTIGSGILTFQGNTGIGINANISPTTNLTLGHINGSTINISNPNLGGAVITSGTFVLNGLSTLNLGTGVVVTTTGANNLISGTGTLTLGTGTVLKH